MKNTFWNAEKLMSLLAILLSVCTLFVFIYQTNLIRKEQYASVFPYLQMGFSGSGSANMSYMLMNEGVGPALIKDVVVLTDEGEYEGSLIELLDELLTKTSRDSLDFVYSDLVPGNMLPAGETIELVRTRNWYSSQKIQEALMTKVEELVVVYESIYGERWRASSNNTVPQKVK